MIAAIVSFPRAGNHLVRYMIEYVTGQLTLGEPTGRDDLGNITDPPLALKENLKGYLSHVDVNTAVAQKVHFVEPVTTLYQTALHTHGVTPSPYSRAMYIFRHPIENYLSYYKGYLKPQKGVEKEDTETCEKIYSFLAQESDPTDKELEFFRPQLSHHFSKLAANLSQFYTMLPMDNGCRIVIFYEDLIGQDKILHAGQILNFIGATPEQSQSFLENIEERYRESLNGPERTPTSGLNDRHHRDKCIKNKKTDKFLDLIAFEQFQNHPTIVHRYFKHIKDNL